MAFATMPFLLHFLLNMKKVTYWFSAVHQTAEAAAGVTAAAETAAAATAEQQHKGKLGAMLYFLGDSLGRVPSCIERM